jgi:NAD(P)-dependent dehydrogenase (short-subunit alcohol dehydrogenase family)
MKLQARRVLITGGNSGIGLPTSVTYATTAAPFEALTAREGNLCAEIRVLVRQP